MWGAITAGMGILGGHMDARENRKIEQMKAEASVRIEEAKQATERLKLEAEKEQKIREMKEKEYQRVHQIKMQQIKEENEQKQREAEAEMERKKQEHIRRLEQMQIDAQERDKNKKIKQKNDSITRMISEIDKLDKLIDIDMTQLEMEKKDLEKATKELDFKQIWLNNFLNYKQLELSKISDKLQLKTAKLNFERDDQQIKSAINKTGQQESDVGRFLMLTHCLLNATVATTANSNRLQCQIQTFDELITRECHDKLTIEQYFYQINLQRFVYILSECQQKYINVDQLKCDDEDELEEILAILQNGLQKQLELEMKEQKQNNNNEIYNDDEKVENKENVNINIELKGEELAVQLLKSWGLINKWNKMKEKEWTDPQDWDYLIEDEKELKELGFKGGAKPKFIREFKAWRIGNKPISAAKQQLLIQKEKYELISIKEMKLIRQICFKPSTWEQFEIEQAQAAKEGLMVFSHILTEFFDRIHAGIKQSQEILNYEITLNNEQQKAIKTIYSMPPQIEYKQNDEKDVENDEEDTENEIKIDDNDDDILDDIRKEWKINSKCEIYSDTSKQWCSAEIIDIVEDNEGEWLNVKYSKKKIKQIGRFSRGIRPSMNSDSNTKLAIQCHALTTAAIVSIDVTDHMMDIFNQNIVTMRALTVARGVEDCCMQIIKAQSTIRQSVLLAQEILKLRPAHMSKEGKILWDAVDAGCIRIYKSAINMVKVSAQYFKFFLRFKHSFQFYEANKDKSLMISLQHVHTDCREFTKFRKEFDVKVEELSIEAMDCITNCVKTMVGASNFEKARNSREITLKKWLDKKAIYDAKALELDEEYERAQIQKINISAERERLQYKVTMLDEVIRSNQEDKKNYVEAKSILDKMVI